MFWKKKEKEYSFYVKTELVLRGGAEINLTGYETFNHKDAQKIIDNRKKIWLKRMKKRKIYTFNNGFVDMKEVVSVSIRTVR